ncbi:MAG: hypothetical protein H7A53_13545 [Akkermansiaceae bacterium]|nr:hypothetical protein [Akkermansiaceae bacterium]MCP5551905.1 hypothetical protein [Akkermansiaceae bacterium]
MTPLHYFGGAIRDAMTAVPMIWVRALFVGLLLALLAWVLCLPRGRVTPPGAADAEARGWSSNLKLWAALALGLQIAIYLIF